MFTTVIPTKVVPLINLDWSSSEDQEESLALEELERDEGEYLVLAKRT